jgi:hypothetical protein
MAVYDRLKGSFRDAEAKRPRQSVAGGGKAVVWIDDFEHKSIGGGSGITDYKEWEKWCSDVVKKRREDLPTDGIGAGGLHLRP